MRLSALLTALAVLALLILPAPRGAHGQSGGGFGEWRMTVTAGGLACGGGRETESAQGAMAPVMLEMDVDKAGLPDFSLDLGKLDLRNRSGFAVAKVNVGGTLDFFAHGILKEKLDGSLSAGWTGRASGRSRLVGEVRTAVEEVKAIEGTRKGYRLSGSYSGKLYNESMVTGGGKDVKGSGKDEGAVSGSFSTCVYLRFSREPDYSRAVKLVKGSLTSSHRNIRIAPGELVYISELVSTRASETAELLYPDGTRLFLEENSAIVILDFHEKKRNGTSWFKSAIRVMKGFLNSIVNPLQGALSGEVPESRLDVYTNYGTTGVHGTSFQVSVSQDGDRVKVLEGEVEVTHRKERKTFTLGARWCATLTEKEMSEEQMEVADLERLRESFSRAVDGAPSLPRPAAPPAPAGQAQSIPPTWQMTETLYEPVSGVWRLRPGGAQLDASWANGAQGIITIEKWSPDEVVLTRFDPSGVSAGLTARYVGKRQGSLIRGTVTWYGRDAEFNGTWEAVLK